MTFCLKGIDFSIVKNTFLMSPRCDASRESLEDPNAGPRSLRKSVAFPSARSDLISLTSFLIQTRPSSACLSPGVRVGHALLPLWIIDKLSPSVADTLLGVRHV